MSEQLIIITAAIALSLYLYRRQSLRLPTPPGPPRYPLIGHLLEIPKTLQWETFARWSKDSGSDVVYAETLGLKFIVLNSYKAAEELLIKRSSRYSSRPQFVMVNEIMGWKYQFVAMPYGEKWRRRRRLFQEHFQPGRHDHYRPVIKDSIDKLMIGLFKDPESFYDRIEHTAGAAALSLGYGIKIKDINDPHVEFSKSFLVEAIRAGAPGNYLVDVIPALKYVPEWFPGAEFKRKGKVWNHMAKEFRNRPFEDGKRALADGTILPQSFLYRSISSISDEKNNEDLMEEIQDVAAVFYSAGADTSKAMIHIFVFIMTSFQDIQRKVRQEIDEKIGYDRLPELNDERNLPYLKAVLLETLRYHTVTPMAIPHFLEEEDIYNNRRMPKGSMVVPNVWAMAHDTKDYFDPFTFNPDRFLDNGNINENVKDPRTYVFGFGRRVCPGSHIAWEILWYTAVSMLANFEILKPLNALGEECEPEPTVESGLIAALSQFECRFKPRPADRERILRMEYLTSDLHSVAA